MAACVVRATRSAQAAGPISSAVESTAPTETAPSATATPSTTMKIASSAPIGTPRAKASSGEETENTAGRQMSARTTRQKADRANTAGVMPGSTENREPKSTAIEELPAERLLRASVRKRAVSPMPAPKTTPVATSRPRMRRTPIACIPSDENTHEATKPHSWSTPSKKAAEPPTAAKSVRACPAKDWPRSTVSTPTAAVATATALPTARAVRTSFTARSSVINAIIACAPTFLLVFSRWRLKT